MVDLTLGTVAPVAKPQLQRWKLSLEKPLNSDPNARLEYPPPKLIIGTHQTLPEKVTVIDKAEAKAFVVARHLLAADFSRLCTPRISSGVYIQVCDYGALSLQRSYLSL